MKKHLITTCLFAVLAASSANAKDGAYVGADMIISKANYKYYGSIPAPQSRIDSNNDVGAGLSAGYKKSFDQVFIAPEVFYDYLNSSSKNYFQTSTAVNASQDTMELRSRYGIKANLGYDFTNDFSTYLTYGIARIDQINNYPSFNASNGKWRTAAIYGIGAQYKLCEKWSVRAELNSQRLNIPFEGMPDASSKVRINALKVGAVYSF